MEIAGTQRIPAPRPAVWEALNDPAVLKRCLPGCESVERSGPEEFKVVVAAAIGPLRAKFNGMLRMTEAKPPASCTMVFEGQGGPVGFGKGSANVELSEAGGETDLGYTAQAQVGGKLAQIGSRMIDSVAKKMSDDFFKAFLKQFQVAPAGPADPAVKDEATRAASTAGLPAAPAPVPTLAPSEAPVAAVGKAAAASAVLVPGWWLAVAAVLGSVFTLAGALLIR